MFDLDAELQRWRRETELTLAFEPDEIDELEDHLKLAVEKAVAQGASLEEAWRSAAKRLGDSPPLAAEFAKSKLMPALFHLLCSWWQVGLLFVLFSLQFASTFSVDWLVGAPGIQLPAQVQSRLVFWVLTYASFLALLALLPGRPARKALILGVGNAFCLIPLLYVAAYNSLGDHWIGPGWSRMGAPMGWWPVTVALIGVAVLNGWGWRRSRPTDVPAIVAISAGIVLVLTVAPFAGELLGNLSIRELYHMPTARDIPYTGDVKSQYMQWKFVDVLVDSCVIIASWLPLALALIISGGIILLQAIARRFQQATPNSGSVFPAQRDLPWLCGLGCGGITWLLATSVEPNFLREVRDMNSHVHHTAGSFYGLPLMTVMSALLFILCAHELTHRLGHANRIRPFFATMIAVIEIAAATLAFVLETMDVYSGTFWRTAFFSLVLVIIATRQIVLIVKRARVGDIEPSSWRFKGSDLVRLGSLLGLIGACAGLFLMEVALVLAFVSTAMISALINWGNSIEHPEKPFDPFSYDSPVAMVTQAHYPTPHLDFWIFSGLSYVSFCLAAGFLVAIVLSGLEFIRFNTYRYYKVRRAERARHDVLAVNE